MQVFAAKATAVAVATEPRTAKISGTEHLRMASLFQRRARNLYGRPPLYYRAEIATVRAIENARSAGFTWKKLAGWLRSPMGKEAWEAIIPSI